MIKLILCIAALSGLALAQVKFKDSYEPLTKMMYFIGNDIRNDPGVLAEKAPGQKTWLDKQTPGRNLLYSKGLARACRNLMLANGPQGIPINTHISASQIDEGGGDPATRAALYTDSAEGVKEVMTSFEWDESKSDSNNGKTAMTAYVNMLKESDEDAKGALWDKDVTHVGISCGCHKEANDVCCLMYGKDVKEKAGVKPMEILAVGETSCEKSTEWSDETPGKVYEDPDGPAVDNWPDPDWTFEDWTGLLQEAFERMSEDPEIWKKDVKDMYAINEAKKFKHIKMAVSKELINIALSYANDAGPCNQDINYSGQTLKKFTEAHMTRFKSLYFIDYKGPYNRDPNIVLVNLLKANKFTPDIMNGLYSDLGVGCGCNSKYQMQCVFIFGYREKILGSSIFGAPWKHMVREKACKEMCPLQQSV